MAFDGITIHEGYNNIGAFQYDITSVEIETSNETKPVTTPVSEALLFKFIFDPSENPVPSDYTVKFDLTPMDDLTAISSEVVARGGKQTFSFTLSSTPIKPGSLSITDGLEVFHDRGDGTLRGSEGGSGTINYTTGSGSVTFFVPPVFGDNVVANYKKHISVSGEDLGASSTATTYNLTLAHGDVVPTSFTLTIGTVTLIDNGSGVLTGTGGSGIIDYATGAITINLTTVPTGHFMANYTYWGAATPETIGTGALTTSFNFKLVHHPLTIGSLSVTDGTEHFTDNSDGTLTGSMGGAGTINYDTGVGTLSFTSSPTWGIEITANYTTGNVIIESHTNSEGYIQINAPIYPVVKVQSSGDTFIDFDVIGTLDNRQKELYLELDGGGTGPIYTLITDMFVKGGYLQVFDGDSTYYKLYPHIAIGTSIAAVKINKKGEVWGYDSTMHKWSYIDTLTFHSIQHPEFLDIVSDGFYSTNTSTGTDTSGHLGDTSTVFEHFEGVVNNPEPYYINVGVSVYEPTAEMPVKMQDFSNLLPGVLTLQTVDVTADPYQSADITPTISDIESVIGVAFSTAFLDFLAAKNINTLDSARRAGPITYIEGFPSSLDPTEVALFQSHVDLFSLNPDPTQNQVLITSGFGDLFTIANTPQDTFLNAVVGVTIPLYTAAKTYELASQNLKLISNLLANTLTDLKLANPQLPAVNGSTFASSVLVQAASSCGCSDCASSASPFSYLMDLISYGAAHVNYIVNNVTIYSAGSSASSFSTFISSTFYQPFGSLDVSCATLNDEYCRVRLVTEVLEKVLDALTLLGQVSAPKLAALADERKKFFLLTYQTLLAKAGTSYSELQKVASMPPSDNKIETATKLSQRLGIPLYNPSSPTQLTVDRIWLTFPATGSQNLNAANLEAVFGFRDTRRNVLTPTPVSLMETWRSDYLRDGWKIEDYPLTEFSREGVIPNNNSTFKSNWKAIVDPDIMCWEDFSLLKGSDSSVASFAKGLYVTRQQDTDDFFTWCLTTSAHLSRTSADMTNRIFRVLGKDITDQVIDNNQVFIENPSGNWTNAYNVLTKTSIGSDTNIQLKKSVPGGSPEPAMLQPVGSSPTLRYKRVINVVSPMSPTVQTFNLTWTDPIFLDALTGGYAKLISSGSATVYETSASTLTVNSISLDKKTINLTITGATGEPTSAFCSGNRQLIFEVEVPLVTDIILDPNDDTSTPVWRLIKKLFTDNMDYPWGAAIPFQYNVWVDPSTWPAPLTATTRYGKLKQLYAIFNAGTETQDLNDFVDTNLHMTKDAFNRMMEILIKCEDYLNAMYTVLRPTDDELYELISIIRNSAKTPLRDKWVKEEINTGTSPYNLQLSSQYFNEPIDEVPVGSWDVRLQNNNLIPIIDPELIDSNQLLSNTEAEPYRSLYDTRKQDLTTKFNSYLAYITAYDPDAYGKMLNEINTGSPGSSYSIPNYASANDALSDLQSGDAFQAKNASDSIWTAFALSANDFVEIMNVRNIYELNDPGQMPTIAAIKKTINLLVSAYKRMQLYPGTGGWLDVEVTGGMILPTGSYPVKYYNVLKMKLAPGRGISDRRSRWQQTLDNWNRQPFVQPDIVPPQNVKDFVPSNWIYTTWNSRNTDLLNDANTLSVNYINNSGNSSNLLDRLEKQIDLAIGRVNSFTPITPLAYYPYFSEISDKEDKGQDIRPFITRIGMTLDEYRYLKNIVDVLTDAGTNPISLQSYEYTDIIDILISVRSRTLPYNKVVEEYNNNVILDQDFFQIYEVEPVNFPLTNLPSFNAWRAPLILRKKWLSTLSSRIERESISVENWKEILMDTDDVCMPLMRDALIRSLLRDCETFDDGAERLAKTYFVETKDNCCVKHTRVSFAIETLQGLLWSIQTGNFDDFIVNFSLVAPYFKREWEWIGSYATWRSAVLVFLYPENLLYPTLRKVQSKDFVDLSNNIQGANSFTPEMACEAAREYQVYFDDVQQLEPICSTNTIATVQKITGDDCCDVVLEDKFFTFFFAQSLTSKRCYWTSKRWDDPSEDALGFWEELPITQNNPTLIGCYRLGKKSDLNNYLWAFYTFYETGILKMGYLKKYLGDPYSQWILGETTVLPTNNIQAGPQSISLSPIAVAACAHANESVDPKFIITYPDYFTNQNDHIYVTWQFEADSYILHGAVYTNLESRARYGISHSTSNQVTFVFENEVVLFTAGGQATPSSIGPSQVVGAFENRCTTGYFTDVVAYIGNSQITVETVYASGPSSNLTTGTLTQSNITGGFKEIIKLYPFFSEYMSINDFRGYYAVKTTGTKFLATNVTFDWATSPTNRKVNAKETFKVAPDTITRLDIQSTDCLSNLAQRATDTQTNLNQVLAAPINFSLYTSMSVIKEYLYEAYYFVPMLLALDQQRRGQYPAALSWYRTVYDYTVNANRKIFYGLVLEQNNQNNFVQNPNWLLDPLNPHYVAKTRINAYTKYTVLNIIQCLFAYADREYTLDTIESVPIARKLYTEGLQLLKISELGLKSNVCQSVSVGCLPSVVTPTDGWQSNFAKLAGKLSDIGDSGIEESLIGGIASLLNGATEATMAASYADAFQLIIDAIPPAPGSETVNDVLNAKADRFNNTGRYLNAINFPGDFSDSIEQMFNAKVADVSGIAADEVSDPAMASQIGWLLQSDHSNNQPYAFNFTFSNGGQYFSGSKQFNPISPTSSSYNGNILYANAKAGIGFTPIGIPVSYSPLIDFKFCIPQNPFYHTLELKGNMELYKIFNCRNIAGMVRELNIYPASIDSGSGIPVIGSMGNLQMPSTNNFAPSQYRFKVLIERAKQIATQAQQMESLFLAALEKEDVENYNQLRAQQDLETTKASIKLQDLRISQAIDEKGIAELQLDKASFMENYFGDLLAAGLNSYEKDSLDLLNDSVFELTSESFAIAGNLAFQFLPIEGLPTPTPSGILSTVQQWFSVQSQIASTQANISSQMASYQRRSQEWEYQKNLAGFDEKISNQQIKISDDNVRIVSQERQIAVLNSDHAQQTLDFLKTKFTNAELYNWMGKILEQCYSYMLNLATGVAKTAESQLYFERQEQAGPFILNDYWEIPSAGYVTATATGTDRRGLTGSARLMVDITRLEQYAFDSNKRKLQITKVISVAQNFPAEFQAFKETGILRFELTNKLFDYDFPGHYLRLINNVKTSVVGLFPVYDQIKATLSADSISYTVIGGDNFTRIPIRRLEMDSVALSSTVNATGVFELNPIQGDLLNPFEGMGVESRWEFIMPQFTNHCDFDNIADILLSIDYTSLDSSVYRYQVLDELDNSIHFNRGFSFKNHFPDQWYDLGEAIEGPDDFSVTIKVVKEMLPVGITNLQIGGDLTIYFVRDDNYTLEIQGVAVQKVLNPPNNGTPLYLSTIDGKLPVDTLMGTLGTNPLMTLKFTFDNTATNREIFSQGKVKDILILFPCQGELKSYPLI